MSSDPKRTGPLSAKKIVAILLALIGLALGVQMFIFWKADAPRTTPDPTASTFGEKRREAAVFAGYAGSQNCYECHAEQFQTWKKSNHALAERPVDLKLDGPAFDPARRFKHGTQTSEVLRAQNRLQVVTLGAGHRRAAFTVERVVGVSPLRQFLVPERGGRFQVTEVAFDPRQGDWFDIFGDEDRQPGEWGHWTGRGMTWNMMCAGCHNTRVQKNYQAETDSYATTMVEHGVGCEACHGPMAAHVTWQRKHPQPPGTIRKTRDPTLRQFDREQVLAVCGSCHARRSELTGDFPPGDPFFDHYSLVIPDESDIYYPDGQVREEDYEFASFLSSRMNLAGVWCLDCHQPHSGKTLASNDGLCLRCHAPPIAPAPKIDPATHSHHQLDKPGGRCVECHMPLTTYMQRHARRDHGYTIPDPLLTKQYGIPNACNRCHADKTTEWSLEAVEKWYGARMDRPTRQRAQWMAQARSGQRDAVGKMLRVLREEKIPLWRASAAILLKRWTAEPDVIPALLERVGDADPLVRAMVARALEPFEGQLTPQVQSALHQLLQDPVRNVRIEAAWSLRSNVDTNSAPARELLRYLALNNDQPSGALQLGTFLLDRGEKDKAVACFQRAVQWDGGSAPLRHALAVGLSLQGKKAEAVRELEAACRLAPREPEYQFRLGLALNEAGQLEPATAALEQAVKLDPQFAQAWYNLGLAFSALGNPDRALDALARAESITPNSPQIPYARATILARVGRIAEARTAASRALELQPGFSDAASLLQALE